MTLQEIKESKAVFLTPAQIAGVLQCDPHLIRIMAKTDPAKLGFPVVILKSRTKIPRIPFLRWIAELS